MHRKIFVSFLGISNYTNAHYGRSSDVSSTIVPTRFVQEATIRAYCSDFSETDLIVILTTQAALKNWEDGEHVNKDTQKKEFHEGLKTRLDALDLLCPVINEMVPDGSSTEEIWAIFEKIYGIFKEHDEVYFDITHGFRSLPMLNLVLINYAKLLKNISVKGIYYGAFEGKKEIDGVFVTPIWELSDFAKLQDWTNNASTFLRTGNATNLVEQINNYQYHDIRENLENFSEFTLGNRGVNLFNGRSIIDLRESLVQDITPSDPAFKALQPILDKIRIEFNGYQENSAINGFLAVRWCIHNGLIQQAATLLEEFITTFIMEEIGIINYLQNYKVRLTVSGALSVGPDKFICNSRIKEEEKELHEEIARNIHGHRYWKELNELVNKVKESVRNDINHAGFRDKPRTFKNMSSSIRKRYKEMAKLVKDLRKINLPTLNN